MDVLGQVAVDTGIRSQLKHIAGIDRLAKWYGLESRYTRFEIGRTQIEQTRQLDSLSHV